MPNLGGCVTSSSSCDSPRIAVPFGPVLHDVLSGHLTGSKVMRLTLDSRAPGFQFTILSWFPQRPVHRCRVREGTHVEAGFPWSL